MITALKWGAIAWAFILLASMCSNDQPDKASGYSVFKSVVPDVMSHVRWRHIIEHEPESIPEVLVATIRNDSDQRIHDFNFHCDVDMHSLADDHNDTVVSGTSTDSIPPHRSKTLRVDVDGGQDEWHYTFDHSKCFMSFDIN